MEINMLIGVAGLLLLLAALFMLLFNKLKESSNSYLLLNIFGGGCLFYYSFTLNSVPFMILQAVWTIIPLYKLVFRK